MIVKDALCARRRGDSAVAFDAPSVTAKLATRQQFAKALTDLRLSADLTVRAVARQAEQRSSTIGGWFSGQHLPQRSQREAFVRVLRACGASDGDVESWVTALERVRAMPVVLPAVGLEPYRGLRSYQAADAEWFFGRESLTADALAALSRAQQADGPAVVAVVAPSGAGKSSLLLAGVVPAVQSSGLTGDVGPWHVEVIGSPSGAPEDWGELESRAVAASRRLIVIDQFEDLFGSGVSEDARAAFLDRLERVSGGPDRVLVIIGLRADFFATAMTYRLLAEILQRSQLLVPPMSEADLRRAISEPARHAGSGVEPELVELLLREVGVHGGRSVHDVAALPLLSHALHATWAAAGGRNLTVADYLSCGGVAGAVQQSAEQLYGELSEAEQELARRVFLRLVNVDPDGTTLTRRHVGRDRLPAGTPDASLDRVLHRFVQARLLTAHEDSIEIGHEVLLASWARLRDWIDTDRTALLVHRRIEYATRLWQESNRDESALLRGARLAAAQELLTDDSQLAPAERDFVRRSRDAAHALSDAHRQRLRRTRQLLGAVAALAVIAAGSTVVSLHAYGVADRDSRASRAAQLAALSRQVALESRDLQSHDPALAEQLALVAWRASQTAEARSALLDQSAEPIITRVLGTPGPTALALSNDGKTIAVGAADGSVHLYAAGAGHIVSQIGLIAGDGKSQVYAVRFIGTWLAVGGMSKHVQLWDVHAPSHPVAGVVLGPDFTGGVQSIAVSPDNATLAAASIGPNPIRLWRITDPTHPTALAGPEGVAGESTQQSVAFSPDGSLLVSAGTSGLGYVWATSKLADPLYRFTVGATDAPTTVNVVMIDKSGQLIAANRLGVIEVRDAHTGALKHTLHIASNSWVNTLAESPDGTELAAGSSDNTLTRWSTATWANLGSTEHAGPVTGVAYSPDGKTMITTAADGTMRLWKAAHSVTPDPDASVFSLAYTANGDTLALADNNRNDAGHLWNMNNDIPTAVGSPLSVTGADGALAIRSDGTLSAVGSVDGHVQLWDTHDPRHPVAVGNPFAGDGALIEVLAFNPAGTLLAVGGDDGAIHLWDLSDPRRPVAQALLKMGAQVFNAAFSPNGSLLGAADANTHAYLWNVTDPATPKRLAELGGFTTYVYAVAFSPNGKLFAATGSDHYTRLWSVTDPAHPTPSGRPLTGPTGYNLGVAFSPDGRLLAIGSNDRNVWLYTVNGSRSLYAKLTAVDGEVNAIAFNPHDGTLVAAGRSNNVPVWTTDPDSYARQLCAVAGTPITKDEWAQYVPGATYTQPCPRR